ncbi:hypothetical protein [Bradyrhizobium diazoefficiens]|uniref:hypothetical protein n=1 Tax=Bradyrhizobium diazoefficiens TaxID=1355477 RepID=UPI00272B5CD0|nr:hypothetical protein [Bradyrhizobium diazoefficiens]WLA69208.1 hypothetical protein QNN01_22720 [Bradyrhizobium diazoefficiens]
MMSGWNITSILGLGAVGLGFLLAFLTYSLLKQPQKNYTPIYVFEFFCFALVLVGAGLQYSASSKDTTAQEELQKVRSNLAGAVQRADAADANLMKAYEVMAGIAKKVPASIADLQEVNRVVTGNYCSGGSNGQPLWGDYGPKTGARTTAVIANLNGTSDAIKSVVPAKYLQAEK